MKFGQNLKDLAIPQWQQCYLKYEHLKIFVSLLKKIIILINLAKGSSESQQEIKNHHPTQENSLHSISVQSPLIQLANQLIEYAHEVNALFYEAHRSGIRINNRFFQMKLLQFDGKYKKCQQLNKLVSQKKQKDQIQTLIQFLYIQACFLRNMKESNTQGERKILKKHRKYADNIIPTPPQKDRESKRLVKELKTSIDQVQNFYVQLSDGPSKKSRTYLRDISNKIEIQHSQSFAFGTWIGICATVIIVLIVLLTYAQKSIQTDAEFNRDFPTWRGIAFFIFYIWILGINTYIFEKFNISHRIIFHYNEHHYSTSTVIFVLAGLFSTLFLIMFTIYTLVIADILLLKAFGSQYLVLFVWVPFILFLINPIPILMWKSRLYTFKLIWISLVSPFIGVPFEVIWMTDQLVSLVTPLKDFAYTICYYQNIDFSIQPDVSDNYCSQATRIQIVFVIGAVAYSYRIIQCIRQGYDKGAYFCKPEFFNTLKYSSSLIALALSYSYKATNPDIFTIWLVFAALTTVYSYFWDLKMDWMLLSCDSPHKLLRKYLTYQPYQIYYVIMITNLIFRLAWLATLSPGIVTDIFGSPQLFSLVTGAIQIMRRGIWNLLRVQREHLANCSNFQAMPSTPDNIQAQLLRQIQKKNGNNESAQSAIVSFALFLQGVQRITKQSEIVSTNFLGLVKEEIQNEEIARIKRQSVIKQIKKKVKELEVKMQQIIGPEMLKKMEDLNDDD